MDAGTLCVGSGSPAIGMIFRPVGCAVLRAAAAAAEGEQARGTLLCTRLLLRLSNILP